MANETIKSFPPLVNRDSEILFLGSAPSILSRRNNFFYGNPTNRFWWLLSQIYQVDFVGVDAAGKTALLQRFKIGLSDVYASCQMKKANSSLDSNITNYVFNDILQIIAGTNIKRIYITSKKAYTDFIKHWNHQLPADVTVTCLPSPSSANRSVYRTDAELLTAWRNIIRPE